MTKKEKDELYQVLLQRQGGVCAICGAAPLERKLAIDHDHQTDKIRGLLCFRCNVAVGFFRDNAELMFCAAEYVNEEQWEIQTMKELNKAWDSSAREGLSLPSARGVIFLRIQKKTGCLWNSGPTPHHPDLWAIVAPVKAPPQIF